MLQKNRTRNLRTVEIELHRFISKADTYIFAILIKSREFPIASGQAKSNYNLVMIKLIYQMIIDRNRELQRTDSI
jgi:hypothetical protein